MSVFSHYLAVIFIWSTTPLAIHFSSDGLSAHAAVMLRMLLAFLLAAVFIAIWQKKSALKRENWQIYMVAGLGIFPNMPLVYMAAKHIQSGLISVIFALTPLISGILAAVFLRERGSGKSQILPVLLAMLGLLIIFYEQISLKPGAMTGIILMLISNMIFSASQVATKHLHNVRATYGGEPVDAFEQTFGALTFSLPGLLLSWWIFDGEFPRHISQQSLMGIVYLSLIGSLLGFAAYFVVLKNLTVAIVSLIPLITPALALWLGSYILAEPVGLTLKLGTGFIVVALIVYDERFIMHVSKRVVNIARRLGSV